MILKITLKMVILILRSPKLSDFAHLWMKSCHASYYILASCAYQKKSHCEWGFVSQPFAFEFCLPLLCNPRQAMIASIHYMVWWGILSLRFRQQTVQFMVASHKCGDGGINLWWHHTRVVMVASHMGGDGGINLWWHHTNL